MAYYFSEEVIARQFFESLDECHIKPKWGLNIGDLIMDGNVYRFPVEGDSSGEKSGAYKIFADDWPNWFVQDYHYHEQMIHFNLDRSRLSYCELSAWNAAHFHERETSQTPEEIEHQRKFFEAKKREKQAQREAEYKKREAFRKQQFECACKEYEEAGFGLYHPYIEERFRTVSFPEFGFSTTIQIPDFNLWEYRREIDPIFPSAEHPHTLGVVLEPVKGSPCKERDLLIPCTDALTDKFRTLQVISSEKNSDGKYQKRFFPGLPIDNICYKFALQTQKVIILGEEVITPGCERADTIFLCEGFCTGVAILTLTKGLYQIYCAMACGNLGNVAQSLRQRFPKMRLILMADNDKATEIKRGRNPGVEAAIKLKRAGLIDGYNIPQITGRENESIDYYDVLIARKKYEFGGKNEH